MNDQPIRVLHVINRLDRGGVETWLMHVLRNLDRRRVAMDFLVNSDSAGAMDDEARSYGARIIPCSDPHQPNVYARELRRVLQRSGPYDVVHAHLQHFNGVVMAVAAKSGISRRIAHSHLDTRPMYANSGPLRNAYLRTMKVLINRYATSMLAVSKESGDALFPANWLGRPTSALLYCGIDLRMFREPENREEARREFGFGPDDLVIGHVAAFRPQKNHQFVLDIAEEFLKRRVAVRIMFIGDGPERTRIEMSAQHRGLTDLLVFTGSRPDVPRMLTSVIDCAILPSVSEGLPLAGIEAQAAGIPIFVSDSTTSELVIVPRLVHRLPVHGQPELWVDAILEHRNVSIPRTESLHKVELSPFNVCWSSLKLEELYGRD